MARMIRPLANLYDQLRKLPGIGSKSAMRLAYHIIDMPPEEVLALANALKEAKANTHFCCRCFNLTDKDVCEICSDDTRDIHTICVVEQPQDIAAMERSHSYHGMYHVLHGALSPLDGIGPNKLKMRELIVRLQQEPISEIILATNSDVEGEATASYLATLLKPSSITVSRIAHGLPIGGDLEYADEITLSKALENRRELS